MTRDNILVTGGAGFIGSHTVEILLELNHKVIVLDNFSTGRMENLQDIKDNPDLHIFNKDIENELWSFLEKIERNLGKITRIIHYAAQTSVSNSIKDPLHDIKLNYNASVNLLEYARIKKIKNIVFASSAAVYGNVTSLPILESFKCEPVSPYGINKYGIELYINYYNQVHNLNATCCRFFNVYGPKQDPKNHYSGVISIFIDKAIKNEPITIFGNGEQTRDFIFVVDVARIVCKLLLTNKNVNQVFNIGTGAKTSINKLAKSIKQLASSTSLISHSPAREGEIKNSLASVEKIKKSIGFQAEVSMDEGLQKTIDWLKKTKSIKPL